MIARASVMVVAIVLVSGRPFAAKPPPQVADFAGTYRYVGGEAEIRGIDAAIDSVVKKMVFFLRPIARRKLRPPNLPSERIEIALEGERIRLSRTGRASVSAPADGTPTSWRSPEGDEFTVREGIDSGALYQRFEDSRSNSVNRFTLSPDRTRLTVETTITARQLPAPLVFKTTYQRESIPARGN